MKTSRTNASAGATLIVLSSLFYGSYGVWTKLMGNSFGSFSQAAIRSVLVVLILLPIALYRHQLQRIAFRRDAKWFIVLILACAFIGPPLYYATLIVGAGLSSTLFYAGFMLAMFVFGYLFNGERFTLDKIISTILGLIGLVLIFSPTSEHFGFLALSAGLVSGVAAALDLIISQKLPYNPSQMTILTWSSGVISYVPVALIIHDTVPPLSISWLYLVCFAVAGLAASWFSISGVKLISAGAAGILGLLEIVFGVLFGVIFFGERPTPIVFTGIIAILLAASIPYLQEYRVRSGATL